MGIAKSHGLVVLRLQKGPHMHLDEERKVVQKLLDASLLSFSASAGILSCKASLPLHLQQCPLP